MLSLKRRTAVRPQVNQIGLPFKGIVAIGDLIGWDDADIADLVSRGYTVQFAGGTTPRNQAAKAPVYFPGNIVVSSDQTINQGDMVWWDGVNFTLKALTTAAQVAVGATGGFCGLAAGSNQLNVYPAPPAGLPSEAFPGIAVQSGGTGFLNLAANDVIDGPFVAVTAGAGDAQTVTRGLASAANRVGVVFVEPPTNARGAPGATPAPETVQGGQAIRVWIERKFPSTVIA